MKDMRCMIVVFLLAGSLFMGFTQGVEADGSDATLQITFSEDLYSTTPGNQGFVIMNLKNIGQETIDGIMISADSDVYYLQQVGDWTRSYGSLSPGSSCSAVFHYSVSSTAQPGLYELELVVTTDNADFHIRSASIKIEDQESIDILSCSPAYLKIGEQTTMTLTLSNNGQVDISDILLSWEDDYSYILPIGADNRVNVPYIEKNNSTEVSFDVMVSPSLPAGVYPIHFTLEYYNHVGTKKMLNSQVGIQIGGVTDFEVIVEESQAGSTTLAIANTGANTASSVIVSIPLQPSHMTSGASSINLGNLEAGDYTLATFQISQLELDGNFSQDQGRMKNQGMGEMNISMENRPGLMGGPFDEMAGSELTVDVTYTDLFGMRQTIQKNVTIDTASSSLLSSTEFPFNREGGNMQGAQSGSSFELDSGNAYILIGVLGIISIVAVIKFDSIRKLISKSSKSKKGKENENK